MSSPKILDVAQYRALIDHFLKRRVLAENLLKNEESSAGFIDLLFALNPDREVWPVFAELEEVAQFFPTRRPSIGSNFNFFDDQQRS